MKQPKPNWDIIKACKSGEVYDMRSFDKWFVINWWLETKPVINGVIRL